MANATKIQAQARTEKGARGAMRLRREGLVPANLYGHGQESQMLSIAEDVVTPLVVSGHKLVEINCGNKVETAMVREVQWHTIDRVITHIDFMRIDVNERVHVVVPVVLKGTAPGSVGVGILEQPVHTLHIEASAADVPDSIIVKIDQLQLGQSIHVRDLIDLPSGVTVKAPGDLVIVHVIVPRAMEVVVDPNAAPAEPELVAKKKKEDEASK